MSGNHRIAGPGVFGNGARESNPTPIAHVSCCVESQYIPHFFFSVEFEALHPLLRYCVLKKSLHVVAVPLFVTEKSFAVSS
jgi:hypothetical protein